MKAILLKGFGAPEQMYIGDTEKPQAKAHEILVKVHATALNRADTLQRKGFYPPPPGASTIMGLEMAGEVAEIGSAVERWKVGDKVCGLLAGGGYAAYATIDERVALPIPEGLDMIEAAAIPEVFLTAFQALKWLAKLQKDENVLIHAGASGVGTAAIQLAKLMGAHKIYATASAGKHQTCLDLGADQVIDYKTQDFEKEILTLTDGKGVDVIVDFVAASYFQQNINSLGMDGRMVILAFLGGMTVSELNMANILRKRLHIMGSTLRARTLDYKINLSKDLQEFAWSHFETGALKPVVDSVWDWSDIAKAHSYMEANKNTGKMILKIK